jgi:hypothetical protein
MWLVRSLLLLSVVVILGCGAGGAPAGPDAEADSTVMSIKSVLEGIAQTGKIDESFGEARGMTDELKETKPEIGNKLSADLDALEALSSPEEIKAKAKEIADGL